MRKLREMARLRFEAGRTLVEIANAVGVARSSVQLTLQRLSTAGLSWPWPDGVDEQALDAQLFPYRPPISTDRDPDFAAVRTQLGRKAVTRWLLWQEYRVSDPEGLSHSSSAPGIDCGATCRTWCYARNTHRAISYSSTMRA